MKVVYLLILALFALTLANSTDHSKSSKSNSLNRSTNRRNHKQNGKNLHKTHSKHEKVYHYKKFTPNQKKMKCLQNCLKRSKQMNYKLNYECHHKCGVTLVDFSKLCRNHPELCKRNLRVRKYHKKGNSKKNPKMMNKKYQISYPFDFRNYQIRKQREFTKVYKKVKYLSNKD